MRIEYAFSQAEVGKGGKWLIRRLNLWEAHLPSLEPSIGANANAIICFKVFHDVLILFSEVSERDQNMTSVKFTPGQSIH